MKFTTFVFQFKAGKISVRAFCYQEAVILAQAKAINNGWNC